MFGFGKNKKQRELENKLNDLTTLVQDLKQEREGTNEEQLNDDERAQKESDQPWVKIVGDRVTEDGIKIDLDWNEAFIKHLVSCGISGKDDTQIVQKWLALIAMEQSERLKSEQLQNGDEYL